MSKSIKLSLLLIVLVLTIAPFTYFVGSELAYAAGAGLVTKATTAQSSFFDFAKRFSIPVAAVMIVVLLLLKKSFAAQGNGGKEQLATAGIWTVVIAFVGIRWGVEIWDTIQTLVG